MNLYLKSEVHDMDEFMNVCFTVCSDVKLFVDTKCQMPRLKMYAQLGLEMIFGLTIVCSI